MNPITIIERLTKGSALTAQEHDDNLNAFKTASEELYTSQPFMSKATAEALANDNKDKFAGSGFIEWGKHEDSTISYPNVNEGIWTLPVKVNKFIMGNDEQTAGISKSNYPIIGVNGAILHINYIGYNALSRSDIELPDAPTVTHADASNSGLILNGKFDTDTTSWTTYAGVALASVSGELTVTGAGAGVNGGFAVSSVLNCVIGKKYIVEYDFLNATSTAFSRICVNPLAPWDNIVAATNSGFGRKTLEFIATASTCYFLTGGSIAVGTETYTYDNIAVFPADEISRTDLTFLESWHEDVSEKDFVYPLGNTQYLGADTDGLTGIANGGFTGFETYSLFGNWHASSALIGKGYAWSTMSDANRQAFVGNPENNCYLDGDTVVQVRYRMRVVQGLGDEWENINPQGISTLSYSYPLNSVQSKGKLTSITSDFTAWTSKYIFFAKGNTLSPNKDQNGLLSGVETDTDRAYEGKCYALPIATIHRRNQGAYHPVFNANGVRFLNDTVSASSGKWYLPFIIDPQSIANCFTATIGTNVTDVGYNTGTGSISSANSGRPDGLFYDQVHEGDITDLRSSAHDTVDAEIMNSIFNDAVSGEVRGSEGEWEVVEQGLIVDATHASNTYLTVGVGLDLEAGDMLYNYTGTVWEKHIISTYSVATIQCVTALNRVLGEPYIVAKRSTRTKSNTLTHCDIIGDPANYYRGQTFTNTGAAQTVDLAIGDVICNRDGNDISGLDGHFYESKIINGALDLSAPDYTITANFTDLGADWDGAGSWRKNRIPGTPLLVGEEGEDYIPDGTAKDYKLSKKADGYPYSVVYSADNGATWTLAYALMTDVAFDLTTNSCTSASFDAVGLIWMVFYTTHTSMAEPTVSSAVRNGAIGDVFACNADGVDIGGTLSSSLISKIQTNSTRPSLFTSNVLEGYAIVSGILNGATEYQPSSSAIPLFASASPAVKVFPYLTEENGRKVINLVFKEMKYDVTWGDDSKFDITDNVSTTTDDNANVVLIGQKKISTPYFTKEK